MTQQSTTLKSLARLGSANSKKGRGLPDFKVEENLQTGHDLVDKIGCIRLQGFLHDNAWLKHPRLQSPDSKRGKTNLAHSVLWAFLVDVYRPIKRMRPDSGDAYYQKKFDGEWFITTYSRLGRLLGFSESQMRKAIIHWRKEGLVGWADAPYARDPEKGNEKPFALWPIPSEVRDVTGRGNVDTVELAGHLSTGNWVCDEMAQIKLHGNVIDYNWPGHEFFRNDRGVTNAALLIVYAELFFLHTPTDRLDPITHKVFARKKKFDGEVLYKGYASWSRESGLTDDQLRDAVAELKKNLATVDWGPIIDRMGEPTNTKVLIALNIDAAIEVTYGTRKVVIKKGETTGKSGSAPSKSGGKSGQQKRGDHSSKSADHSLENGDRSPQSADHSLESGDHPSQTGQLHSEVPTSSLLGTEFPQQHQGATENGSEQVSASRVVESSKDDGEAATPRTHHRSYSGPGAAHEQVSLPIATLTPMPPPLEALPLRDFVLALANYQNLPLDSETAARIAARLQIDGRPAAQVTEQQLIDLLTRSRERVFLDTPIGGNRPRRLAEEETDKLRWYLAIWPAFPESTTAFWEKKRKKHTRTSCFINRFDTNQAPPESWLCNQVAEFEKERATQLRAQMRQEALAIAATLSPSEITALDAVASERARRMPSENLTATRERIRIELLCDPAFVEDLRAGKFEVKAAPKSHTSATPAQASAPEQGSGAMDDKAFGQLAYSLFMKWVEGWDAERVNARICELVPLEADQERMSLEVKTYVDHYLAQKAKEAVAA